ncbi:MAG: hypothetical protein AAB575_04960 [Patescibacteria group bacterium]
MSSKKGFVRIKIRLADFCESAKRIPTSPMNSYEIIDKKGRVMAVLLGKNELENAAFRDIPFCADFDKLLADFFEAQKLVDKIGKREKYSPDELARAKRKLESAWKVLGGKGETESAERTGRRKAKDDVNSDASIMRMLREIDQEDREDLAAAWKAMKEKGLNISFDQLEEELKKKDAGSKKISNKKGEGNGNNRKTSKA